MIQIVFGLSIAFAASSLNGRGRDRVYFGARAARTCVGSNPSRSASQRMKLFTEDNLRAKERAPRPRPRSEAMNARISDCETSRNFAKPNPSP